MPNADTQQLLVDLRLRDQLSGGIATAKAELRGLETNVAGVTSRVGGLGSSLGSLAKVTVGAFAGFAALSGATEFFSSAISEAQAEEKSIALLTSSLKANVPAWDENTAAIEKTLAARMRLGHSDDEQRESLARLVAATHDVNQALDLERTAMDLAAFKSVDLLTASTALIKVEGGQFRALKELIGSTKDITTSEQALAAVHAATAGAAEALANTNEGKLRASQIAVGEAMEKFGLVILPLVATAAKVAADGITTLADVADSALGPIGALGREVGDLVDRLDDIGPHVPDATEILNFFTTPAQAAPAATSALLTYTAAMDAAHLEYVSGLTTIDEYIAKQDALEAALNADTAAQTAVAQSAQEAARAFLVGAEGADTYTTAQLNAAQAAANVREASTGASADINDLGLTAQATALYISRDLSASLATLKEDIEAVPRDIEIVVSLNSASVAAAEADLLRLRHLGEEPGQTATFGGPAVKPFEQTIPIRDPDRVRFEQDQERDRKSRRDKAAADALAAAKEQARKEAAAYKDALDNAFEGAKRTANSLFDALHNRHLQAIKDAETLAQKNHDTALQQIADNLKAQQSANAAPVNAAETALRERQAAQQRRDLVEAQQAAQQAVGANRDPAQAADLVRQLRSATEALVNFDASAAIERLKAVQGGLDATAQGVADKATAAADAQLAVAKKQAQAEQDAETVANAKRRQDFETQLKALRERDEKAGKSPAQVRTDIDALGRRFGIVTDPRTGAHHIENPLIAAIKDLRESPPVFAPVFNPTFRVFISAREVAAAIAAGNQPAATAAVRTGQAGRV